MPLPLKVALGFWCFSIWSYDSEPTHRIMTRTLPCFLHLFKWYDESSLKWNYLRLILWVRLQISTPPIRLEFLIQCLYSSQSRAWGFKAAGWSQTRECCREVSLVGWHIQTGTHQFVSNLHYAWQLTFCMEILIVQVAIKINRAQFLPLIQCHEWVNMHLGMH